MRLWRVAVVVLLVAVPFLFLAAAGSYWMWEHGLMLVVWLPLSLVMTAGYLLGWYWQRNKQLLRPPEFAPQMHWTERDRQAWQLVEARAKAAAKVDPAKFVEPKIYVETAEQMALELARFYHPGTKDPVGSLTIPEILAVVELASHDMGELVDEYLPAGHLLTVNNWRQARQAMDWYPHLNTAYWLVSAVFSPINTAVRYAVNHFGTGKSFEMLQQNLLLWFYVSYVHRIGTYLIEVNSGRLRVGVKRYRELMQREEAQPQQPQTEQPRPADEADQVLRLGVTLMGQVKAGKSSLVNALLGEQKAITDVLPATAQVQRYELQPRDIPTRLVLMDTVGYGHTGPKEDQLRATEESALQSDLLLLVLHARNPARQADLEMLRRLRGWFAERPDLKMPPVLAVLTHIDLLSPALEWAPPYDWQKPSRPKEVQMQQAAAAVREQLGEYLAGVVPVCAAEGRVYGVAEWLVPAVAALLGEGRAVALLRVLHAEIDARKTRKVLQQVLAAGREAIRIFWESRSR